MARYVRTARLDPSKADAYCAMHAEPWPEVVRLLRAAGLYEYTIHLNAEASMLVGVFNHDGPDLQASLDAMNRSPVARAWAMETRACLLPAGGIEDAWSAPRQVFELERPSALL